MAGLWNDRMGGQDADLQPGPHSVAALDRSMSEPVFPSPRHQHWRAPSTHRHVKETLNARTQYSENGVDGSAFYRINQYVIKQEIGRGSFGSVHVCMDQYHHEYAIKEFSKSRLRKRAQSDMLRRRSRQVGAVSQPSTPDNQKSVDFIRGEMAIMKKLDHSNLVSLIEVLDDPDEDSLYMVMEMCKNGVVMSVNLDQRADPYDLESCRCWFRDMILGIEYLHAQGIVHRDIKPDNCLLTSNNILKISDFGVSEMFQTESGMMTSKHAGSPAFMPPELCVAKHGEVSGQAADIWSMGVTLYCLRYGRLPFERSNIIELLDAIVSDTPELYDCTPDFQNLIMRILEKDPVKRITMDELRIHPWVTRNGTDPLMSKEANTAYLLEPPTQQEVNHAITGRMTSLVTLMRATSRFKSLLSHRKGSIHGRAMLERGPGGVMRSAGASSPFQSSTTAGSRRVRTTNDLDRINDHSPLDTTTESLMESSKKLGTNIQYPFGTTEADYDELDMMEEPSSIDCMMTTSVVVNDPTKMTTPTSQLDPSEGRSCSIHRNNHFVQCSSTHPPTIHGHETTDTKALTLGPIVDGLQPFLHYYPTTTGKGQAHDPLQDTVFLGIGLGLDRDRGESLETGDDQLGGSEWTVSESPTSAEENIFERAFWNQISEIISNDQNTNTTEGLSDTGDGNNRGETPIDNPESTGNYRVGGDDRVSSMRSSTGGSGTGPVLYLTKWVDHNPEVQALAAPYLAKSEASKILDVSPTSVTEPIPQQTTALNFVNILSPKDKNERNDPEATHELLEQ